MVVVVEELSLSSVVTPWVSIVTTGVFVVNVAAVVVSISSSFLLSPSLVLSSTVVESTDDPIVVP